jgi:hypothetical protein
VGFDSPLGNKEPPKENVKIKKLKNVRDFKGSEKEKS